MAVEGSALKSSCAESTSYLFPINSSNSRLCVSEVKPVPDLKESFILPEAPSVSSMNDACNNKVVNFESDKNNASTTLLSDKLELQYSEACEKRFIMFDHSVSKSRIILHPALIHEFSALVPDAFRGIADKMSHLKDAGASAADILKETMVRTSAHDDLMDWKSRLSAYRETMASAFLALSKMGAKDLCTTGDVDGGGFLPSPYTAADAESSSRVSGDGVHDGRSQCLLHENTDLEALLSSDEEVSSTGHSPSEVTWNAAINSSDISISNRKIIARKCEKSDNTNGTEVNSQPLVTEPEATPNWEPVIASNYHSDAGDPSYSKFIFLGGSATNVYGQVSSRSRATNNTHPGSAKKSRKRKIRQTVRLLRSIIPGGDCKDSASILDEAILYVKSLQAKVQKLEAKEL